MGKRSPVLGYNHNFKHRGLIFHVQTEDSGVDNPHLFTHLFHGGVIISSRKIDYDAEAEVDVVKGLMQSQHKAVAKGLRTGSFDEKIDSYLGTHKDLEPRKADSAAGQVEVEEPTAPVATAEADTEDEPVEETHVSAAPSDMIDLDAAPHEEQGGLTFDAVDTGEQELLNIEDEAASTDEMPTVSLSAADIRGDGGDEKSPTADVDTEAAIAVAEAQAAADEARELAAQAAAEAAHARQLQEAAAAATARAAELEARVAASQSKAHKVAAHSGAISLDGAAKQPGDTKRTTRTEPIVDNPAAPPRRRHLPTAVEMPAYKEENLGDPTVTFSSGPSKPKPAKKPEPQAVPEQITGERSGTYSMKRQSTTQRMSKRVPTQRPRRTGSGPVVTGTRRTGSVPVVTGTRRTGSGPVETGPGTQHPRGRTGSNPAMPSRGARRSATGKAANPEPGRPRSPVVVSRPAVIIGAPPKMVGKGERKTQPRKARSGSVFGKDLISEKSLDEVIMAYLSEDGSEE